MSEPKTPPESAPPPDGAAGAKAGPPPGEEELQALRTRAAERDQYLDLARRTQADFENYQRRHTRLREEERQRMLGNLMRDMLPVLDNLERALQAAREAGEKGPLVQGVIMVQSLFLDILRRYGVKPIDAEGKPFDHNLHEAVTQLATAEVPPNTVMHVLERGFMIEDRVLRPAKVVVAAPAPASADKKT